MSDDIFCVYCAAQIHELCSSPIDKSEDIYVQCCCYSDKVIEVGVSGIPAPNLAGLLAASLAGDKERRVLHDAAQLKDPTSTGRKRAAEVKVFEEGAICEWAGLKFAGGGVNPIIGCAGNILTKERGKYARHHGPDKNVINNEPDNLHLICPRCHNRWHSRNDEFYGDGTGSSRPEKGKSWVPVEPNMWTLHDAITVATSSDILQNEMFWATSKNARNKIEETISDEDTTDL